MPSPYDQSRYQVRLEWGTSGLARLAPADIVLVVDVLLFSTEVIDAVAAGEDAPLPAEPASGTAAAVAALAGGSGALVLAAGLRNAAAAAQEVLAEQVRRGGRTSIAVIAAGAEDGRMTVEDQLGAGAVIDALAALGIDHSSPEAAAACEAFRGLGAAVRHLLTASGSGQELLEAGRRDDVIAAAQLDATTAVPVLRAGVFTAA